VRRAAEGAGTSPGRARRRRRSEEEEEERGVEAARRRPPARRIDERRFVISESKFAPARQRRDE
jgi:hypothetical protein